MSSALLPIPDWSDVEGQTIPLRRVWEVLGLFESTEYAQRLIGEQAARQGVVGYTPSMDTARDLVACVKHARGYFEASENASPLVSPLLLFYGISSLAKAVVVARHSRLSLHNMPKGHGLTAGNLSVGKGTDVSDAVMAYGARVTVDGTLPAYAESLRGAMAFKVYDDTAKRPTTYKLETAAPPTLVDKEIRLDQLLARQPAIRSLFHHAHGERAINYHGATSVEFGAAKPLYRVFVAGDQPLEELELQVRATFPQLRGCVASRRDQGEALPAFDRPCLCFETPLPLPMFPTSAALGMGHSSGGASGYFVGPFDFGPLSEALQLYVLSYLLGMLVRYYPSIWMELVVGGLHDRVMPLLRAASDLLRERFPVLALEGLTSSAHELSFTTF